MRQPKYHMIQGPAVVHYKQHCNRAARIVESSRNIAARRMSWLENNRWLKLFLLIMTCAPFSFVFEQLNMFVHLPASFINPTNRMIPYSLSVLGKLLAS